MSGACNAANEKEINPNLTKKSQSNQPPGLEMFPSFVIRGGIRHCQIWIGFHVFHFNWVAAENAASAGNFSNAPFHKNSSCNFSPPWLWTVNDMWKIKIVNGSFLGFVLSSQPNYMLPTEIHMGPPTFLHQIEKNFGIGLMKKVRLLGSEDISSSSLSATLSSPSLSYPSWSWSCWSPDDIPFVDHHGEWFSDELGSRHHYSLFWLAWEKNQCNLVFLRTLAPWKLI